jgi:hypothetical protein
MSRDHVQSALHATTALLVLVLISTSCSAGVISAGATANPATERDIMLTMQARRALLLDTELAPLNLGVRVHNRVATLWGPVPSADLAFKAEQRLRGLLELLAVRNDLIIAPGSAPAMAPLPASFLPLPPSPALPAIAPGHAAPPPLPPPPTIGAPAPIIDETELPPRRLPQGK